MAVYHSGGQYLGPESNFWDYGMFSGNPLVDMAGWHLASQIGTGTGLGLPFLGDLVKFDKVKFLGGPSSARWAPTMNQFAQRQIGKSGFGKFGGRFVQSMLGGEKALSTMAKAGVGKTGVAAMGAWGMLGAAAQVVNVIGGMTFANAVPSIAGMGVEMLSQYGAQQRRVQRERQFTGQIEMYGKGFRNTRMASTMRQSSMALIQQSQLGVRSALSREAFHMHR